MAKRTVQFALLLTLGIPSSMAFRAPLQQESTVFRVEVEMVLLTVAVTDGHGNYVTGLRPGDFEIYEDNISQQLATFSEGSAIPKKITEFVQLQGQPRLAPPYPVKSAGRGRGINPRPPLPEESADPPVSPLAGASVFVLFDTSNFMYRGFVYAQQAIADFVRTVDRSDRVAFYSFSRDVKRVAPISADRQGILSAVRSTVAGDDVALYNALLLTVKDAAQLSGRKMVVVFSNGPDNASMVPPESVRELAEAEGIPIYMISTHEAMRDPVTTKLFERLTATTGGKAYFAKTWQEQRRAFASIREDLVHLYTLSYYPKQNPNLGWRRITVKLVGNNLHKYHVRTRAGYRPKSLRTYRQAAGP
jgi:VWFA-related protein